MLPNLLLIFSLIFPFCQSTGYVELRLKSVIDLPNATFTVHYDFSKEEKIEVYNVSLVANKTRIVTGIRVNFARSPGMSISTGPMNKYGFLRRETNIPRYKKRITTEKVEIPFIGLRFERVCDRNWYGLDCDYFCNNDYAAVVGRRCTQDGNVGCPFGFHGPACDHLIDQKAPECQCQNEGICVSRFESPLDSKYDFICECPTGWWSWKCAFEDQHRWIFHSIYDENWEEYLEQEEDVDNEFYER